MAQPLYFLPGVKITREMTVAAKRQILQAAGIADIFADVKLETLPIMPIDTLGPGEKSGSIVCYHDSQNSVPPRFGFFPDQQTWHAIDDGSLLWIGLHNDNPPTPAELQRSKVFRGYEMELGDGNTWQIPVIRRPTDLWTALPQSQYIEGGKLVQSLKAAYRSYWDHSAEVADGFIAGKEFTVIRAHELAVEALGLNYRFGPNEQKILGIVDSENYIALLSYTIDLPHVNEVLDFQKKTTPQPAESLTT